MVVESPSSNRPYRNMSDDLKTDDRLNVLYSPFRRKELNPQDWESKMSFWKNNIMNWCLNNKSCVLTVSKLQSVFIRNGRPATCLGTVFTDMLRSNELINMQELLSKDPSSQSWSTWAVNCFVKTPLMWSFTKLKQSLVTAPESNADEEYIHLAVLKKYSEELMGSSKSRGGSQTLSVEEVKALLGVTDELTVRVTLHWLQLQGQAVVTTMDGQTVVKLGAGGERVSPLTEADRGLYQLQQIHRTLVLLLEQLEKERQEADQEARNYLRKGMRQVAKSSLRKKKELEKCIDKRASALENVQVLLSRVKEAESDAEILESYKMGLSALKATFKNAGLSEDGVSHTMDQVREVLEVHEEIQNALSETVATGMDEDLESELAKLLSQTGNSVPDTVGLHSTQPLLDLPEPPTHSPTTSSVKTTPRTAQSLH